MTGKKQKRSPKQRRFDGKQKHGSSRARYFAQAPYRIAANKARRIAKEKKRQADAAKARNKEALGYGG